ncbi:MAG TPA: hypothetical protein VF516_09585 [Kofleriaceae bacterium]
MPGIRETLVRIGALVAGIALASCHAGDNIRGDAHCPVECAVDCPPDVACPDYAICAAPPRYICPPGYKQIGSSSRLDPPRAWPSTNTSADTAGASTAHR